MREALGQEVCDERVMLPQGAASTITAEGAALTLRALDDGSVQAELEGGDGHVLLRVTDPVQLFDGDLLGAGRQWLSFEAGRDGLPGRLHVLDRDGETCLAIALRGESLSLGRDVGDVQLPWDDALAELHLQVLVRPEGTYVQDLASAGGTWLVVRSGEVLCSGSTLALGDRLVRVSTVPDLATVAHASTGPARIGTAA